MTSKIKNVSSENIFFYMRGKYAMGQVIVLPLFVKILFRYASILLYMK